MVFKQELVLPKVTSPLTASEVIKAAVAFASYSKSTVIVKDDESTFNCLIYLLILKFLIEG